MTSLGTIIYFMTLSVYHSHKSTKLLSCENVQLSVGRLQMVYPEDTLKTLPCSSYLNERLEIAKRCLSLLVLSAPCCVNTRLTPRLSTTYSILFVSSPYNFLPLFYLQPSTSYYRGQSAILKFRMDSTFLDSL